MNLKNSLNERNLMQKKKKSLFFDDFIYMKSEVNLTYVDRLQKVDGEGG